jgi:hypothetical protein
VNADRLGGERREQQQHHGEGHHALADATTVGAFTEREGQRDAGVADGQRALAQAAQQRRLELEADQEHEEHQAELADGRA